ncbi:hypothetical protein XBLMG947_1871 [Xanthomonas bromi]|uniref:Uncharacterized protein n=1 Tax=Xanthomonas bromi TaxID=56449 RepID=A0A1C3NL48_9XANT|nr:hypothetical protein XBLMG947_1871 [Xanthomonas bromi]
MLIEHHHCPQCDIAPVREAANPKTCESSVAVNVRCLPPLDLTSLSVQLVDGASR